ncbi:uncharacterized protein LOC114363960 [Ostrinia furnacalis]|uniref:uncharacterized protein LOC114363960 n=1 Tax=Ostrinia furnacalis TaxID=93504 RepID=UPI00103DC5D3|nr:uncharacterized protein LOC114363960 [Ostrinia furnacalis]
MYLNLLVFVTGIISIMGRPTEEDNDINSSGSSNPILQWPLESNTFLFPTILNSNDVINITVLNNCNSFGISFMGDYDGSTDKAIFSLKINMESRYVTVYDEYNVLLVEEDIYHFFHNGEENLINMRLKRRLNADTAENNILEISTNSIQRTFVVNKIDKIRYFQFSDKNVKVINLDFKFA